jgi:hypothetical protein
MSQLPINSFVVISELQYKNQSGNFFFRFYRIYRILFEKLRIFDKIFEKKKFEKNGHSNYNTHEATKVAHARCKSKNVVNYPLYHILHLY